LTERLRQTWRISRLFFHIAVGLLLSSVVFPFVGARGRRACFRWWSRHLLGIVRMRVRVHGEPHAFPAGAPHMLLSNHVSWLDVYVLRAHVDCRFIAKSEIRHWPVVGWLVSRQGTVFVQRARRTDTARVNDAVEQALKSGEAIAVFPEGTTTDGSEVRPFHASLLQPLVHVHGWAVPVAIRYVLPDGSRDATPAYITDVSLWESTKRVTARPCLEAELHFGEPVHSVGRHRRDLAQVTAASVAGALGLPSPDRVRPVKAAA
jgi:1-acyl-sn-glycerol-3-phosphate acyltransferase